MNIEAIVTKATELAIQVGVKIVGAIALYIVGRVLIHIAVKFVDRALSHKRFDETLRRYALAVVRVVLHIVLIVALLGYFGVETTSFAALLAAAGVAIGAAWAGLLSNFAAGIFIMVLRPFKVGDFIQGGGVMGTVKEIGLFVTALDAPDGVRTLVGNAKLFGDNILNFSANGSRRVDLRAQLHHTVNVKEAIAEVKGAIGAVDNVLTEPALSVDVLEFNLAGPVLFVRPHATPENFWQVYCDTNKAIAEVCGKYPVPEKRLLVRNAS